jgi:hypothetical protein
MVQRFLKPYTGQEVGGELDLMLLIGGAEERAAVQLKMCLRKVAMKTFLSTNQHYQIQLSTYCLPYTAQGLHKRPTITFHPEDGNCSVCRNVG